jgi:hypothetical protein
MNDVINTSELDFLSEDELEESLRLVFNALVARRQECEMLATSLQHIQQALARCRMQR